MLLTERDMKIMRFINEFGFCEMPQIEKMFGLRKPRNYKVMQRLVKAELVMHEYVLRNRHGIYRLTREGAECTDYPMLKYVSLGSYLHQLTVVDVYLKLMQRFPDATWISERQLKREQYIKGSFTRYGHVADGMLIFPDEKKIAIEVELTMKGKDRLDKIIRSYIRNREINGVWYYCSPDIVNRVKKAVDWWSDVQVFGLGELLG
jgi:predicted transcriptional regulator